MIPTISVSRRLLLATALATPVVPFAAVPSTRRLAFNVIRNGARIGEHLMVFTGDDAQPTVTTDVAMTLKIGGVPIYRYRHHAVERWSGGHFKDLETTTNSNGKAEHVRAARSDAAVVIESGRGKVTAAGNMSPLTHWNSAALAGPLFNPQEGKVLKVRATEIKPGHWTLRGEIEIDDHYDAYGNWSALETKLIDGSKVEYRRA